ncbi:RBM17 [Lepeophtheirus salmonis]|uniref:Splicing factor 45 n=1 Tax=Lepeophtheirus salmonis TaxID=72036 RepID=A0A7R8CH69_LEPSM|nr:RBM17 [Lepeophtheirus salmonis]CAF2777328.1 RBM17 [Lepeophtheirus salmonis]
MSLYDDEEVGLTDAGEAVGWSRGIQRPAPPIVTHTPPPILKAAKPLKPIIVPIVASTVLTPATTSTASTPIPKRSNTLAPVINLQSNRQSYKAQVESTYTYNTDKSSRTDRTLIPLTDPNWTPSNEYDPLWPNDYEKVVADIRDMKRQTQEEIAETKKRRYTENSRERARERFNQTLSPSSSGFSRRRHSDDEEDEERRGSRRRRERRSNTGSSSAGGGAAIAPPPSLTETSNPSEFVPPGGSMTDKGGGMAGLDVAAKIMAKYGYKQGQGLGRDEQGMSMALSVEKTSKRGGRIVHEKDLKQQPPEDTSPNTLQGMVLCKNMVGPGEVDEFLEPEVKEECNEKYGDVVRVFIYEVSNASSEEDAVRIFIEFKRVESAIKAVVDLNGRFFGGREVQANFYDFHKFNNQKLDE